MTEILVNVYDIKVIDMFFFIHLTVKKLNTPEYRHYLKLWNEETKPKRENTKDLPKLNQVTFHPSVSVFIHTV